MWWLRKALWYSLGNSSLIRATVITCTACGRDDSRQTNQTSIKVPSVTTKTCVTLTFDLCIMATASDQTKLQDPPLTLKSPVWGNFGFLVKNCNGERQVDKTKAVCRYCSAEVANIFPVFQFKSLLCEPAPFVYSQNQEVSTPSTI